MNIRIITIALLLATLPVSAQKKKTVVNDSNTPLHLHRLSIQRMPPAPRAHPARNIGARDGS